MTTQDKWLEAARRLAINLHDRVICPKCGRYVLTVRDVDADEIHFERVLKCPECNAKEVIFMKKPGNEAEI